MWLADGWPDALATGWPYALWVGLVEMGVTFLLWQQALKRTNNVARISQLIFLSPFLSLLLIGSVLGESVRATTIIGLFIIVTGVVLTQRGARTLDQPSGS
jgi:drug/metabolite transporter (DMT)-like permease